MSEFCEYCSIAFAITHAQVALRCDNCQRRVCSDACSGSCKTCAAVWCVHCAEESQFGPCSECFERCSLCRPNDTLSCVDCGRKKCRVCFQGSSTICPYYCQNCDDWVCGDCLELEEYECQTCNELFHRCEELECANCNNVVCDDCTAQCMGCSSRLCEDCVSECCDQCDAQYCGACCALHFVECEDCSAQICPECASTCDVCNKTICFRDCKITCTRCHASRCSSCRKKCC